MRPELFNIPGLNLSIKSYGFMMAVGFICALLWAQFLARRKGANPEHLANFGGIALISGVLGARLFHVAHHWSTYRDDPAAIFAVWSGGLEFLGGFVLALASMLVYFKVKKLPVRQYLDILAPAVMLGLMFGRIGCLLNGCCFGGPCDLPWAVRFPALNTHTEGGLGCAHHERQQYSYSYHYQLEPDRQRRPGQGPLLELPDDYYRGYVGPEGDWVARQEEAPPERRELYHRYPLTATELTEAQREALAAGAYPMHPIHPTQVYSALNALLLAGLLSWLLLRGHLPTGAVFAIMLLLYGPTRFGIESLRNDSPLEVDGMTISQNLGIACVVLGVVLLVDAYRRARRQATS